MLNSMCNLKQLISLGSLVLLLVPGTTESRSFPPKRIPIDEASHTKSVNPGKEVSPDDNRGPSLTGKPTSRDLMMGTSLLAKLWREASLPDNRRTPQEVITHYQRVIDASIKVESPFESWYLAVTHFGMARAYSRLKETDSVRMHLRLAVEKNFWNFDVMYADPILRDCAGPNFIDSLATHYKTVRNESIESWPVQVPIVHGPNELREWADRAANVDAWFTDKTLRKRTLDSIYQAKMLELQKRLKLQDDDKINVIIALHGGNASYREFGSHWPSIGQMTNSYVICPPGYTRYSKCINGWEGEYGEMDNYLLSVVELLRNKKGEFPNIYLTGYSQGACLAMKFGLAHPNIVKGVISFSGFMDMEIPQEIAEEARKNGLKFFAISGEYDSPQYKESLAMAKTTLDHHGVPFKFLEEKRVTHELPEPVFFYFMEAWNWLRS